MIFINENTPYLLNSIGLCLDIIGAWFIAWEITSKYTGTKFNKVGGATCGSLPEDPETIEYKEYETNKFKRMKFGLILLTIGFSLQIISNIIQL